MLLFRPRLHRRRPVASFSARGSFRTRPTRPRSRGASRSTRVIPPARRRELDPALAESRRGARDRQSPCTPGRRRATPTATQSLVVVRVETRLTLLAVPIPVATSPCRVARPLRHRERHDERPDRRGDCPPPGGRRNSPAVGRADRRRGVSPDYVRHRERSSAPSTSRGLGFPRGACGRPSYT